MLIFRPPLTRQPVIAKVDRSNPLCNGIALATTGDDVGSPRFDAAKKAAWSSANGPTRNFTPAGRGYKFAAASTQYLVSTASAVGNIPANGAVTIGAVAIPADTTTRGTLIALGSSTDATPYVWLEVNNIAAGAATFNTRDSANALNAQTTTSATFVAGRPIAALAIQYNAALRKVFLNSLAGSGSDTTDQSANGGGNFVVDSTALGAVYRGVGSIVVPFEGAILLGVAWPRALSDAEVASWLANPWQLFAPLWRRWWAPASTTPVLSAAGAVSIATTTATPQVTVTF